MQIIKHKYWLRYEELRSTYKLFNLFPHFTGEWEYDKKEFKEYCQSLKNSNPGRMNNFETII